MMRKFQGGRWPSQMNEPPFPPVVENEMVEHYRERWLSTHEAYHIASRQWNGFCEGFGGIVYNTPEYKRIFDDKSPEWREAYRVGRVERVRAHPVHRKVSR